MTQTPQQAEAGLPRRLLRKILARSASLLPKRPHAWQMRLHGKPFVVWLNEAIGRRLFFARRFEDADIDAFGSLLKAGDTVLDVGGNIGLHAIAFSAIVGPTGAVHSFEPFRRNALLIALNAELNHANNVHIHELVLSDQAGLTMAATVPLDDTAFAYFSVTQSPKAGERRVTTTTIDKFISEMRIQRIAAVKIDVEGAEYNVLKGSSALFADADASPRFAMVEVAREHLARFGHSWHDIASFFRSYGYSAFVLKQHALQPVSASNVPDCVNVFFRKNS